ncbi:L,D-transpeptidase family protein [candidate division KSB1 bacterium]|nr:L,D-transpeptidase family protein [candidate division KSB1 bacterium]
MMQKEIKLSYIILLAAFVLLTIVLIIVFVIQHEPGLTDQLAEKLAEKYSHSIHSSQIIVGCDTTRADSLLARFYRQRNFLSAWVNNKGLIASGDSLLTAIRAADREGLNPGDYHVQLLDSLLRKLGMDLKTKVPVHIEHLLNLEIFLTDAFLLYGNHLLSGRLHPETIDPEWLTDRPETDMVAVLNAALGSGKIQKALKNLLPDIPCYEKLREEMAFYKAIALQGGWPIVPPGQPMKKGDRGLHVSALSARLIMSGDLSARSLEAKSLFDDTLETAVKKFQDRHGLRADGEVGAGTIAALNVPASHYFHRIAVNMERWRWLPKGLGERYILVNIAAFTLDVVDKGQTVLHMAVVVGKDYRRTPVFSSKMSYLVLNPFWYVPPTIATEDILPAVKKDPNYLKTRNIIVMRKWNDTEPIDPFTVDWSSLTKENLPYLFRQAAGQQNALGRIKFMFPNSYDIYLHDTPTRSDFKSLQRAQSSGCIRLEDPIALAEYVLRGDPKWNREAIVAALDSVENYSIKLPEPLPVHLFYCTAYVAEDGTIHFREDIYDRDGAVEAALKSEMVLMY